MGATAACAPQLQTLLLPLCKLVMITHRCVSLYKSKTIQKNHHEYYMFVILVHAVDEVDVGSRPRLS